MHLRRILLAFSMAVSAASATFADLVQLDSTANGNSTDRLEALTRTLAQGAYTHPDDMDIPANTQLNVRIREANPIELNNASLNKKYSTNTKSSTNSFKGNNSVYSWLVTHPLPDMKRVSSNYGGRTMGGRAEHHSGIDLSAPTGTPIYATGPGLVTKSGWGSGYGQYVEINHGNGYITRYAHASRLIAREGDRVQAGEHIANVGCTGRCTGPHLHYEVVKDGQRKNPSTYLAMLP
jgi:murein DD-endopeptidase MepM/ murein hydrolase activator NlpD